MNVQTFRIGEQAILLPIPRAQVCTTTEPPFGAVVTVISTLQRDDLQMRNWVYYRIEAGDGRRFRVGPGYLQKLPPSDPAYLRFREQLVREFAMDAEPPVLEPRHPSIVAMLQLIGQDGGR